MPRSQLTLGEMIDALKLIARRHDDGESAFTVRLAFASCVPTTLGSYRGYYEQLAIGWTAEYRDVAVKEFQALLEGAIGKDFEGYKGGTYTMNRDTPMWIANSGDTGSSPVVDIIDAGWCAVIETAWGGD